VHLEYSINIPYFKLTTLISMLADCVSFVRLFNCVLLATIISYKYVY
jgi:hypothetical protein